MNKKIIIGSRGSKLALIYAQNAKNKIIQNTNLNDEDIIIKKITTKVRFLLNNLKFDKQYQLYKIFLCKTKKIFLYDF